MMLTARQSPKRSVQYRTLLGVVTLPWALACVVALLLWGLV